MNNKGVTLIELLIVIVVMGIIATFTITSVVDIIENTSKKLDIANAEAVGDSVSQAFDDGVIIIRNNALYNTETLRAYSGTGTWFFDDMGNYLVNRIVPQYKEAQNTHNKDGSTYKFRFSVSGNELTVYYYDKDKNKLPLYTTVLE